MAQPAATPPDGDQEPPVADPPVDPDAFAKAFIRERARRVARDEHIVDQRKARIRYWIVVAALVLTAAILTASIWDQLKSLFGIGT